MIKHIIIYGILHIRIRLILPKRRYIFERRIIIYMTDSKAPTPQKAPAAPVVLATPAKPVTAVVPAPVQASVPAPALAAPAKKFYNLESIFFGSHIFR